MSRPKIFGVVVDISSTKTYPIMTTVIINIYNNVASGAESDKREKLPPLTFGPASRVRWLLKVVENKFIKFV